MWITEYDFGLDSEAIEAVPYQSTFAHAVHHLYETMQYMVRTPDMEVMITNNLNGFSGGYRLIDSYANRNDVNDEDGNACKYAKWDGNDNFLLLHSFGRVTNLKGCQTVFCYSKNCFLCDAVVLKNAENSEFPILNVP